MNGFSENQGASALRKFPLEARPAMEGRMIRHVESRKFFKIEGCDDETVHIRYCMGGVGKAAYGPTMSRTWEQVARLYNVVPAERL